MPDLRDTPWPAEGWFRTRSGRSVRTDPAAPLRGVEVESPSHRDLLLGVDLAARSPPITDRWVRGRDMTVVCEPVDARHLKATVTWRQVAESAGVDAWEVIVSAQTSLLDSDATLSVVSHLAVGELMMAVGAAGWTTAGRGPLAPGTTATLARRPTTSVLIAVHPVDLRRIEVEIHDSHARIDCRLFASSVEKGVLLRSRVLAAIGPRPGDEDWAAERLAAFAASPPPLTT